MLIYVALTVFLVSIIGFWLLNFLGLPGNWLIVAVAGLWCWFTPIPFDFSWVVVVVLLLLAVLGEVLEFAASVMGAKRTGGSSRAATLSIVGSIAGGLAGAFVGLPIPIPLVGVLISSLLFASAGAMLGAFAGERWIGRSSAASWHVGRAAFVGRLLGTLGKITVGSTLVVIAVLAPFMF